MTVGYIAIVQMDNIELPRYIHDKVFKINQFNSVTYTKDEYIKSAAKYADDIYYLLAAALKAGD